MIVGLLSPPPYCGCRRHLGGADVVAVDAGAHQRVDHGLLRSLVWFIAAVTSGAMASIETLTVKVSGVPCTSPEPTTVT